MYMLHVTMHTLIPYTHCIFTPCALHMYDIYPYTHGSYMHYICTMYTLCTVYGHDTCTVYARYAVN